MSISLRRPRVQSVPAVIETLSDIDARRRATAFISCEESIAFICKSALLHLVRLVRSDESRVKKKSHLFLSFAGTLHAVSAV